MTLENDTTASGAVDGSDDGAPSGKPYDRALFRRLHHVCVVVHDLQATVAYYQSLGVGPWFDYPKGTAYTELNVDDPEASASMKYQCVNFPNFQLQLCQPSELDSPQRRFLDTFGEGVYHLGFETDDLDADIARGTALGLGIVGSGVRADRTGFCYFDTRERAGITLEIRRTQHADAAAPLAADHAGRG